MFPASVYAYFNGAQIQVKLEKLPTFKKLKKLAKKEGLHLSKAHLGRDDQQLYYLSDCRGKSVIFNKIDLIEYFSKLTKG